MNSASVTRALQEARTIVDEVLPWELGLRNSSMADRTELRKAALPVVFTALLGSPDPDPDPVPLDIDIPADDDDLVTSGQAAAMLGMKRCGTVVEYARRGLMPGRRTPGGRWRFRKGDVRRFQFSPEPHDGVPERGSVPIGDIVRMREADGLSWREMAAKTGLSGGTLAGRYHKWKAKQAAGDASPAEQPDEPGG